MHFIYALIIGTEGCNSPHVIATILQILLLLQIYATQDAISQFTAIDIFNFTANTSLEKTIKKRPPLKVRSNIKT